MRGRKLGLQSLLPCIYVHSFLIGCVVMCVAAWPVVPHCTIAGWCGCPLSAQPNRCSYMHSSAGSVLYAQAKTHGDPLSQPIPRRARVHMAKTRRGTSGKGCPNPNQHQPASLIGHMLWRVDRPHVRSIRQVWRAGRPATPKQRCPAASWCSRQHTAPSRLAKATGQLRRGRMRLVFGQEADLAQKPARRCGRARLLSRGWYMPRSGVQPDKRGLRELPGRHVLL